MKFSRRIQCNIVDGLPKGHPCHLRLVILNHLILFDWLLYLQKCPSYKIKQAEAEFHVWRSYRGVIIPVVEVICTELIVILLGGKDVCAIWDDEFSICSHLTSWVGVELDWPHVQAVKIIETESWEILPPAALRTAVNHCCKGQLLTSWMGNWDSEDLLFI